MRQEETTDLEGFGLWVLKPLARIAEGIDNEASRIADGDDPKGAGENIVLLSHYLRNRLLDAKDWLDDYHVRHRR